MPLLIGSDLSGLDPKIVAALDDIIAPLQTWAAQVDGVNAQERINALVAGITGLSTVKPGFGGLWFTDTPPDGYIFADGSAVSRTTYATLFALWGVRHGAGDGSTTFNTPNLTQRFPLGKAASGTGSTLGVTGGAIDHTHSVPNHQHNVSLGGSHGHGWNGGTTTSAGVHTHTAGGTTADATGNEYANGQAGIDYTFSKYTHTHAFSTTTSSDGAHTHGPGSLDIAQSSHSHVTDTDGGSTSGTHNPPFFVVQFAIKY